MATRMTCGVTWCDLQGVHTWVPLKSQRGQPVGAVQVALYWMQLGDGVPHDCSSAAASPLQR